MRIENSDGAAITDIAAWEKVFEKEPHHWKPGRSAHAIAAKVDESFGDTVSKVYRQAKSREDSGAVTNAPARVEELLAANGLQGDPADCNLRYQLLYATVGTTAAEADLCVLFVGVFRTELYDSARGVENLEDYLEFMKGVGGRRGPRPAEPVRVAFPNEHVRGRRCYSGRTGASAKLPLCSKSRRGNARRSGLTVHRPCQPDRTGVA